MMFCPVNSASARSLALRQVAHPKLSSVGHSLLILVTFLFSGCDKSSSSPSNESVAAPQVDPKAEFEWGMKRLERMLKRTRPSTADGLYTERKMAYELFPPDDAQEQYSAVVTISTESEFIHGKRNIGKKKDEKKSEDAAKPKFEDPNDADSRLVDEAFDIPGMGPKAPKTTAPPIETRTIETDQVFELIYRDQQWQLKSPPEEELGKRWFEYAFPQRDSDT